MKTINSPMLNIAVKAARKAANVIQRATHNLDAIRIEKKSANDFVTEVDKAAEQVIIDVLTEAFPFHAILAEESGLQGNQSDVQTEFEWIIDPIDGTTNFLHGHPQYAISIALAQKGIIQQAVVFDPNRNEMFTASRGVGAFLNDRRIRVSKRINLQECVIATGFPVTDMSYLDRYLGFLKIFIGKTAGLRREGAASLDLCNVACGRVDGYFEYNLKPWDIAAGSLIVQEAGGMVTDFAGEQDWLVSGNVVAGSPKILAQILAVVGSDPRKLDEQAL